MLPLDAHALTRVAPGVERNEIHLDVLAFGAKIIRPDGSAHLAHVAVVEPLEEAVEQIVPAGQLGGTRQISTAQFAFVHSNAMALVASQDGPFTIFAWSVCEDMLYAYRIDTLLL